MATEDETESERRDAWAAAKTAVGVYARDRSNSHAEQVGVALIRLNQLNRASLWREQRAKWLKSG